MTPRPVTAVSLMTPDETHDIVSQLPGPFVQPESMDDGKASDATSVLATDFRLQGFPVCCSETVLDAA